MPLCTDFSARSRICIATLKAFSCNARFIAKLHAAHSGASMREVRRERAQMPDYGRPDGALRLSGDAMKNCDSVSPSVLFRDIAPRNVYSFAIWRAVNSVASGVECRLNDIRSHLRPS